MSLLLTKSEQGIVVFHFWKNLNYTVRMFLSFTLILAGIAFQYTTFDLLPGIVLVLSGNVLLLVKGYDSRIKLGTFQHESEWVAAEPAQLDKIAELNKKVRKWDISAFDITSGYGAFLFILIIISLILLIANNPFHGYQSLILLATNVVILIIPHWFTGVRRITTLPALVNKIGLYRGIVKNFNDDLKEDKVSFLMHLKGKDKKMPADVKMKIRLKNQSDDFLGMYAQISLNNVQGKDYPYFYVVLVAKESSGIIRNKLRGLEMPRNVISEYSTQDDAEILVIRQFTTKKSGYHTDARAIDTILRTGLKAGRLLF